MVCQVNSYHNEGFSAIGRSDGKSPLSPEAALSGKLYPFKLKLNRIFKYPSSDYRGKRVEKTP
jgi:hypothetical protein